MSEHSCREILFDGANNKLRCKCKAAVLRTYRGLVSNNRPEKFALQAAIRIYRHHHPKDTKEDSRLTVERWVYAGRHH